MRAAEPSGQPPYGPQASFPPQYPGVSQGYPRYPYGPYPAGPPRTNGLAIASLVISIISATPVLLGLLLALYDAFALLVVWASLLLCTPLGIIGTVLGIVALIQIRRRKQRGRALAIGGLAFSVVPLATVLFFVYMHHWHY
jgi:Domain of unknown function (DUF4190)